MLTVSHLRKEYATTVAVDDVSIAVQRKEIFGLLGPNGAGKTTTIRAILNIIEPDNGQILFDGIPYNPGISNRIGYLPEERGLYKKNKLLHTIQYLASLKGIPSRTAAIEGRKWLERFNLQQYIHRKVEELSKGNQQKVQFIVSILHNPDLVILDEPFSGLDPVNQILMKDILMDLRSQGKAIIFSTHQMDQAEKLCDNICVINYGRVVLEGDISEIKKRYGKNSLHIEFDGDGSFLKTMPEFQKADVYQNFAEVQLADHGSVNDILRQLVQRLEIRKFEIMEPSLNSIFIDVVGSKGGKA
ncbi:MAG: ATP-binding cassette domain-containing protein [Bacteroidota bacterium]